MECEYADVRNDRTEYEDYAQGEDELSIWAG